MRLWTAVVAPWSSLLREEGRTPHSKFSQEAVGWVGDSTWFMREGIEFIRKVDEAWVPSAVFGSDTRNVGGADGGGTMCAMVGGGVGEWGI